MASSKKSKALGFTLWVVLLFMIASTWSIFNQHPWKYKGIISSDVKVYYEILPATFIHGDPLYHFLDSTTSSNIEYWVEKDVNTGHNYAKTTIGLAYLYAPAFIAVKTYNDLIGQTVGDFDSPYQFSVALSTLLFAILGLYYARKVLLHFFTERIAGTTLIILAIGTGFWHYTVMAIGYSHVFSAALMAMYIWNNIRYKETNSIKNLIWISFLLGLIAVIRPSNILIALWTVIFIPEGLGLNILTFWKPRIRSLLSVLPLFFLPIIPQLLLWKAVSGHWFMNSYGEETFFFLQPHLLDGLFGFRNGLFVYAPLLLMLFPGLFLLYRINKNLFASTTIFMALNSYVMYSWWCWWYGGSFGSRPQVDTLIITIIPVGYFIQWALKVKVRSIVTYIALTFGCILCLFQSYQAEKAVIHWDSMTGSMYAGVFGTMNKPFDTAYRLQFPDYDGARRGHEYPIRVNENISEGEIKFSQVEEFPVSKTFPIDTIMNSGVTKLYSMIYFKPDDAFNQELKMVMTIENSKGEQRAYESIDLYDANHSRNEWHTTRMEISIPEGLDIGSIVKCYIWNPNKQSISIKNYHMTNY